MKTTHALLSAAVLLLPASALWSAADDTLTPQQSHEDYLRESYVKTEHMVPMRDGVRLYTIVYAPKDDTEEYPVMLLRTPYSIGPYEPDRFLSPLGPTAEFDRNGYIFVFQDVRGKFRSEGEFEVIKPLARDRPGSGDVDESTDNYDTIEWALEHLPNDNGRVGQWGISYPGWQTVMGMVDRHPALVASSPQASPSDMFIGDDWHHNGAFRIMYAFSWLSSNARRYGRAPPSRGRVASTTALRGDTGSSWRPGRLQASTTSTSTATLSLGTTSWSTGRTTSTGNGRMPCCTWTASITRS